MKNNSVVRVLGNCWAFRKQVVMILAPALLLPIVLHPVDSFLPHPKLAEGAYVFFLIFVYWLSKALPAPVIFLLPMLLYPMLRIVPARVIARRYLPDTVMLFIGVTLTTLVMEKAKIFRRLVLKLVVAFGLEPRWLLASFMLSAWLISVCAFNPVVMATFAPITLHFFNTVETILQSSNFQRSREARPESMTEPPVDVIDYLLGESGSIPRNRRHLMNSLRDMLQVAIFYSTCLGGAVIYTSSETNMIAKHLMESQYYCLKESLIPIPFLSWMALSVPVSLVLLTILWLLLLVCYTGPSYTFGFKSSPPGYFNAYEQNLLQADLQAVLCRLPRFQWKDIVILTGFLVLLALLLTRVIYCWNVDHYSGWGVIAPGYIKESCAAILIAVVLNVIPSSLPKKVKQTETKKENLYALLQPIVDLEEVLKSFPFGEILVIGGTSATVYCAQIVGLPINIAESLHFATVNINATLLLFIIICVMTVGSCVLPKGPCLMVAIPLLNQLGRLRFKNPLFLSLPCSLAISLSLPIFGGAKIFFHGSVSKMKVVTAIVLNLITVALVFLAATTWGEFFIGHLYSSHRTTTILYYYNTSIPSKSCPGSSVYSYPLSEN